MRFLDGEAVLREGGVSRPNLVFACLVSIAAIVLGAMFLAAVGWLLDAVMAFPAAMGGLKFGPGGMIRSFAWLPALFIACAVLAIGWQILVALSARYVLTDRRLIVSRGILSRGISQTELHRVQDVHVRQDVVGRILNYGQVYVETAGTGGTMRLAYVPDPLSWSDSIFAALH